MTVPVCRSLSGFVMPLGDTATNEIMRFEGGLKFYKVDKTTDGYFVGFNAPLDPRIQNFGC